MQQNLFYCPKKTFCSSNQNLIDLEKCFVGTKKEFLLHKYQQNIFVDLAKLFSQCVFLVVICNLQLPQLLENLLLLPRSLPTER